jgi:hypothetical protein
MKKIFLLFFGVVCVSVIHAQSDSTLKEYTGKYTFPDGSVVADVTISLDNGALSMAASVGTSPLEKGAAEDTYIITAFQGTAVFKRNDAKKIVGIVIDAMGYHLEGTKDTNSSKNIFFREEKFLFVHKR